MSLVFHISEDAAGSEIEFLKALVKAAGVLTTLKSESLHTIFHEEKLLSTLVTAVAIEVFLKYCINSSAH